MAGWKDRDESLLLLLGFSKQVLINHTRADSTFMSKNKVGWFMESW